MKPGKVLCCTLLFAILGVDPAQNLKTFKRWLRVFMQITNRNIALKGHCHGHFLAFSVKRHQNYD